jgi:hypothetical protein
MAGVLDSITEGLTIKNQIIMNYEDCVTLKQRLDGLVREGKARQIPPPKGVDGRGYDWYLDVATGDLYCYGAPNAPALPEWKKFDLRGPEPASPIQ